MSGSAPTAWQNGSTAAGSRANPSRLDELLAHEHHRASSRARASDRAARQMFLSPDAMGLLDLGSCCARRLELDSPIVGSSDASAGDRSLGLPFCPSPARPFGISFSERDLIAWSTLDGPWTDPPATLSSVAFVLVVATTPRSRYDLRSVGAGRSDRHHTATSSRAGPLSGSSRGTSSPMSADRIVLFDGLDFSRLPSDTPDIKVSLMTVEAPESSALEASERGDAF